VAPRVIRWARVVSFLGHPLLTTSAFLLFIGHRSAAVSLRASVFVIAAVVIPLALWNLLNTRAGTYSNFDVSTRTQRHSMYGVSLALLVLAAVTLYASDVAFPLRLGMTCMLALFAVSAAANSRLKVSLHAAISFYLSVIMLAIDLRWGIPLLGCAVMVSISRLVLRRHTGVELVWGGFLGVAAGVSFLTLLH
jgi:membrane-associated phospholipid phosphatase